MLPASLLVLPALGVADQPDLFAQAAANGRQFERAVVAARRVLTVWLTEADPKTLLLPDYVNVEPYQCRRGA